MNSAASGIVLQSHEAECRCLLLFLHLQMALPVNHTAMNPAYRCHIQKQLGTQLGKHPKTG